MKNPGSLEKTRGWEALCDLLTRTSQTELAERTGLLQSAISAIVRLHKKPSLKEALAFGKEGIAPELWAQPVATHARKKSVA